MFDFNSIVNDLYRERERLDGVIAVLQELEGGKTAAPKPVRGRKFMSQEERGEVSERMRRYWESRRAGKRRS